MRRVALDPTWFPDMSDELRAMFARVTKGILEGNAGPPAREVFKVNGQYVSTPANLFFMSINFMKVHQPYADSLVENDTRIGHVLDKVRALGVGVVVMSIIALRAGSTRILAGCEPSFRHAATAWAQISACSFAARASSAFAPEKSGRLR